MPESPPPPSPPHSEADSASGGRARATTTSTTSTATPPKLEQDFTLDLGGDFGKMLLGMDKRGSVVTVRENQLGRQALVPRSLTGNRLNQPSPLQIDRTARVEASPYSWSSQNSGDQLLTSSPTVATGNENAPPVPRHASPLAGRGHRPTPSAETGLKRASAVFGKRRSAAEYGDAEDEDSRLLKDSLSTVNKFLSGATAASAQSSGRYRRNDDSNRQVSAESTSSRFDAKGEDNLFDTSLAQSSRAAHRYMARKPSPPRNKVMTPAQFERYRQDKERQGTQVETTKPEQENDEDDNYEDDEDEVEKSKQAAKQRRKQEAHMTVYRQQMMKVTGESGGLGARPSMQTSFSTPNLGGSGPGVSPTGNSDGSDDDEEVPLAILAAHGFPNKNRPPNRLSTMASNPNLRPATATASYQRPGSAVGDAPGTPSAGGGGGGNGRLPPFARNLPQDPYFGAGLVNPAVRESLSFGGGAPSPGQLPPGGLIGVIANEERSRAMRRGSPAVDPHKPMLSFSSGPQFDPVAGIPHQMMYAGAPAPPMLTPGDHAQIQMTQQMQQFMQMQMQFMQMMTSNGGNGGQQPPGLMPGQAMGGMGMGMGMEMGTPDMMRHSFVDNGSVVHMPPSRPDGHTRTMSMVQPSSASWIQPLSAGYAPSIRVQGVNGYAPSIAPSERSNIGLPGRYRPVSQAPPPMPGQLPKSSTVSGALGGWDQVRKQTNRSPLQKSTGNSDDDEEEGWEAMKAKRDKKKSLWRTKKDLGSELGALIS